MRNAWLSAGQHHCHRPEALTPHPNSTPASRIFIRGVGNLDDQITQDSSVAVYMDGVHVGRSQDLANSAIFGDPRSYGLDISVTF
jgi:hypothetical protein